MLDNIKREWKRDRNMCAYMLTWLFLVIACVPLGVYIACHNWYLNTPERLADPVNWIWCISIIITYAIMRIWGKRI